MVEDDDEEIERLIEEELRHLDNSNITNDEEDVQIKANMENELDDGAYNSTIASYLQALKDNEKRAEKVLQESKELITNLETYKIDSDELLEEKLKYELYNEEENVLCIRDKVLGDLEEQEKVEKNLENRDGENLAVDIIRPGVLDEIKGLEEQAENELKQLQQKQIEDAEKQRKLEDKRRKEEMVFNIMIEERKFQQQKKIEKLKEENEKQQKILMERLENELQTEEDEIKEFQNKIDENLNQILEVEKERLTQMKDEMRQMEDEKQKKAAICIQKYYRRYRVQKEHLTTLTRLKKERIQKQEEEFKRKMKEEQEQRAKELKLKMESEKQKMEEAKRAKEREQDERLTKYNEMKMKVKEDFKKNKESKENIEKSDNSEKDFWKSDQSESSVQKTDQSEPHRLELKFQKDDQSKELKQDEKCNMPQELLKKSNVSENLDECHQPQNNDINKLPQPKSSLQKRNQSEGNQHELNESEKGVLLKSDNTVKKIIEVSNFNDIENKDALNHMPNEAKKEETSDKINNVIGELTDNSQNQENMNICITETSQKGKLLDCEKGNKLDDSTAMIEKKVNDDKTVEIEMHSLDTQKKSFIKEEFEIENQGSQDTNQIDFKTSNAVYHSSHDPIQDDSNCEDLEKQSSTLRESKVTTACSKIASSRSQPATLDEIEKVDTHRSTNIDFVLHKKIKTEIDELRIDESLVPQANDSNISVLTDDVTRMNASIDTSMKDSDGHEKFLPTVLVQLYETWRKQISELKRPELPKRKNRMVISASERKLPSLTKEHILQFNDSLKEEVIILKDIQSKHKMDTIPRHCPKLKILYCQDCHLQHCGGFDELQSIRFVMLRNCLCSNIVLKLKNLTILNISLNKISSLHGLNELASLQYLDASKNNITRIAGIEALDQLLYLNLDDNQLISTKGLQYCHSLVSLSLRHNNITLITEVKYLHQLVKADFSGNNLSEAPLLTNNALLCSLVMNENGITNVDNLCQAWLPLLRHLSLDNNSLGQLPNLSNLMHLSTVSMKGNFVKTTNDIDAIVSNNRFLKQICLEDNPLMDFPTKVSASPINKYLVPTITSDTVLNEEKSAQHTFTSCCIEDSKKLLCLCATIESKSLVDNLKNHEEINDLVNEKIESLNELRCECEKILSTHKNILDENGAYRSRDNKTSSPLDENSCKDVESKSRDQEAQSVLSENERMEFDLPKCDVGQRRKNYNDMEIQKVVTIQAYYRAYRVRKAYLSFKTYLASTESAMNDGIVDDDVMSDFDYDEEIDLKDFEFNKDLMVEWKPGPTPTLPNRVPPLPDISSTVPECSREASVCEGNEVKRAWRTPSTLETARSATSDGTTELGMETDRSSAASRKNLDIANEWGFQSSRTAELMLRRAKKMGKHGKKKKLDPKERYELFKKMDSSTNHPVIDATKRKPTQRQSYFERYASPQFLEEEQKSKDMVFSWVCNQTIFHQDRIGDIDAPSSHFTDSKSTHRSDVSNTRSPNEGTIFPPIDSSILAGKPVTLIQSEVHNPRPPVKEKPRSGSTRRRKILSNDEQETKSHSAPSGRTKHVSQQLDKEDRWKNCAYR